MVFCLFAATAQAAEMVRVTEVIDGRTIVVSPGRTVRLAGVEITHAVGARELLTWTLHNAWVLLEPPPRAVDDGKLVYRSPDAMLINRELVLRGYARATLPGIEPVNRVTMVYLGESMPGEKASSSRQTPPRVQRPSSGLRPPSPPRGRRSSPRAR